MTRTRKHKVDENGRECSRCGEYKPWDEYAPSAPAKGGETRCNGCMAEKGHVWRARPEVQAAEHYRWIDRWQAAHPGEEYSPKRIGRNVIGRQAQRAGITEAELRTLMESAVFGLGLCDLHGGPEVMKYKGGEVRSLSIDHDHSCTQGHLPQKCCAYCVRGLLCCDCNRNVIRRAEQWPALAMRFADYLSRRPLTGTID